jgi:predicted transcriptional regulator
MARRRVTVSLGDDVLRALDDAAQRSGETRSRLIERTLARQLVGATLQQVRATATDPGLGDDEATALAYGEVRAARQARRAKRAAS